MSTDMCNVFALGKWIWFETALGAGVMTFRLRISQDYSSWSYFV